MVRIPRPVLDDVLDHARRGHPLEVCGILAGRWSDDGDHGIVDAYPTTNVHHEPRTEYLIDPREQLEVTLEVEDERGLDVVGYYHSHPTGWDALSETDEAKANQPGACYLLVWWPGQPEEGAGAWTWRPDDGGFREEELDVVPDVEASDAG